MNQNATLRIPGLLLLALLAAVFALGMVLNTGSAFAATGNHTLTVKYGGWQDFDPSALKDSSKTELTLYRVGDCAKAGGSWDITLVPALSDITLTKEEIAAMNSGEKADQIQAWLNKAAVIDQEIMSNEGLQKELKAETTSDNPQTFTSNGSATFNGLEQGIYLVHGGSQWVETTDKYWSPQPMLVQVLTQSTEANLKPVSKTAVDEITVVKAWAGEKDKSLRPGEIHVQLAYDGEEVETLALNEENSWTATYKTKEKKDPLKWAASEVEVLRGYTPTVNVSEVVNGKMTITITNTTTDEDTNTLQLVKILPVFVNHGDKVSTSFIFEISGYKGSNLAYHRYAGLQFDKAGEQTLKVENIPLGLSRVVVKEIGTANYKVKDGGEKEATLDGDVYKVSFENIYDDTTNYEGGVINKYKQTGGKYVFDFREGIVKE